MYHYNQIPENGRLHFINSGRQRTTSRDSSFTSLESLVHAKPHYPRGATCWETNPPIPTQPLERMLHVCVQISPASLACSFRGRPSF